MKGFRAPRRSWPLSRGSRGRIILTWLGLTIGTWVLVISLQLLMWQLILFAAKASHSYFYARTVYPLAVQLLSAIVATIVGPIYPIALTLIYYDQRIRREGFDIEHMMAAAGMTANEWMLSSDEAATATEKVPIVGEFGEKDPAGAKARSILLAFSARLKSCPDTKPRQESFSAVAKARSILLAFSARLKSCPDTRAPATDLAALRTPKKRKFRLEEMKEESYNPTLNAKNAFRMGHPTVVNEHPPASCSLQEFPA